MFKEFSILWKQSDDEIRKFIDEHGSLGIHQFKFRGPVAVPGTRDFFYIDRDNYMLRPMEEIVPIRSETMNDIRLESQKMFLLISLNQALKEKDAPKVREILKEFIIIWDEPLWDEPHASQFDDWTILNMGVPMVLENIYSNLLSRVGLIIKLERKSLEPSEDNKSLYFKERLGGFDIKPICLLAAIWYELIREISIKGHTVGLCHFCGKLFTSERKNAKTCCPEHQKTLKQRTYRRVHGASDKPGRPPKGKTKKEN